MTERDAFGRETAGGGESGGEAVLPGRGLDESGGEPDLGESGGEPVLPGRGLVGPDGEADLPGSGLVEPDGGPDLAAGHGGRLPAHPPELRGPSAEPAAGLGGLLVEAIGLFRAHLWMFVAIAGGVAAVVNLILGFGLGELTSRYEGQTSQSVGLITLAAAAAVTTPLITGMLAQAVLDIRAGQAPSAGRAVQRGLDLFAPILLTILLYIGAVIAGFLLIVPGIYLGVSWYFVAQAVVVDDRRGFAALARSGELVKGNWWRALAAGLLFNIVVAVPSQVVNLVFDAAARAADAEGVVVVGEIFFQAVSLPFVAIGATLFYLRLRDEPRPVTIGR